MEIKVFRKFNNKLFVEWSDLWEKSDNAHFFNSPEWFKVNLETLNYEKYLIFTVFEKNELVGVLPLVERRVYGIPVLTDANNFFSEKSALLTKDDSLDIIQFIVNNALESGNILLRELPKRLAKYIDTDKAHKFSYLSSVCLFIKLDENPLKELNKKQKSKIRNKIKKNKSIKFETITKIGKREIQLMQNIEYRSYKNFRNKSVLNKNKNLKLIRNLIKYAGKFLRLDIINYKEDEIVYGLGLIFKDTYLAYLTAFDKRFSKLSPGKILLYFLLNDLKDQGFKTFDFARGLSVLKKEFTKDFNLQYDVYLVRNIFLYHHFKVINAVRRLKMIIFNQKNNYDNLYLFKTL